MHPFTTKPALALGRLGEIGLIEQIRRWLGDTSPAGAAGIGDDCAVLPASAKAQVITVDPIVFGRHFDGSVSPREAAAKLLKRNLSDLAAMGARPTAAVVALALDRQVKVRWLEEFHRGLAACARRYAVKIVGGDVAQADGVLIATLTLLGRVSGKRLLLRTGARRGDFICATGRLGGSLLGHHLRFEPRLREGAWLAGRPEVRSMMDLSDGLAKDIHALTPAGCRAAIRAAHVPVSRDATLRAKQTGATALLHALTDGEDYELLFSVDRNSDYEAFEAKWKRRFKTRLSRLGKFETRTASKGSDEIDFSRISGYEHLR